LSLDRDRLFYTSKLIDNVSAPEGHKRLLDDRVEFKLYAAEQHLNRLKEIENAYGDVARDDARLEVEMEIDCFLSQVVGAVDSLLFQINDRLELGLSADRVNFANVQSALSAKTKKIDLLSDLDTARQQGNWYYLLSELRNRSFHDTFLKKMASRPGDIRLLKIQRQEEPFDRVMDMGVIPYLEKSLQQVRDLVSVIRAGEPSLQA
jgi:hypothetical protein